MTLKHQFPVRDLLIGEKKKNPVSETGSNWGVPGPGARTGGPWPRGARATKLKKKTLHEREMGGKSPENCTNDEKWHSNINFPLVFCGSRKNNSQSV